MSFALRPGVRRAEVTGGAVLLDERTGVYYRLNETAARMLASLLDAEPVPVIAQRVAAAHDVEPASVAADLRGLVDRLRALGLVAADAAERGLPSRRDQPVSVERELPSRRDQP